MGVSARSGMTPSAGAPAGRSTARPAAATPSAPVTAPPPGAGGTSGWSSPFRPRPPSRSSSGAPPVPGPPVPFPGGRSPTRPVPQDAGPTDATVVALPAAPVPRPFAFAGDRGYGGHETASPGRRSRGRLTVVSKFYPDANLYAPPPAYSGHGRPRVKGAKQPTRRGGGGREGGADAIERGVVRRGPRRGGGERDGAPVQSGPGTGRGRPGVGKGGRRIPKAGRRARRRG